MEPRAYQSGAAGTPPALPATAVRGYPQGAAPTIKATTPGPYWFYMVGEEIRNAIIDGGQTPSPRDNSQLYRAIRAIGERAGSI